MAKYNQLLQPPPPLYPRTRVFFITIKCTESSVKCQGNSYKYLTNRQTQHTIMEWKLLQVMNAVYNVYNHFIFNNEHCITYSYQAKPGYISVIPVTEVFVDYSPAFADNYSD